MKLRQTSTKKNIAWAVVACAGWVAFWLSTQALFMTNIPILSKALLSSHNVTTSFLALTIWILIVAVVAVLAWAKFSHNNFSFLRVEHRQRWILYAYIPILILAVLVAFKTPFGVPGWLWVVGIIATTFFQDILTFGFLQTMLEKHLSGVVAAVVTAGMFFAGHFLLVGNIPTLQTMLLYLVAFPLFAFLRLKTKTIYATDIIHVVFLLLGGLL